MSDSKNFFKFNLVPPKTKEEIITLEERDNSVLYAFFLIFFAVIIFTVFSLGKLLLIDPRESELNQLISQKEQQIANYNSIKQLNGEIYIKSNALAPIVEQDIKLTQLIEVADLLIENSPNTVIINYGRELTGKFSVTFEMENYSDINNISFNAERIDVLKDFDIKNIAQEVPGAKVYASVLFTITNIK